MLVVSLLLALLILQVPDASSMEALEQTVREYWEALRSRDKASALRFVYPDDQNNFIYRKDMGIRTWELSNLETVSGTEVKVTVETERTIGGDTFPMQFTEVWQQTENGWKVRIGSLKDAYQRATSAFEGASPQLPPGLTWSPEQLRIYQIARPKRGNMVLRNGTTDPILVQSFEVDPKLFEIVSLPSRIDPQETARIIVAYVGDETAENQQSTAVLRVRLAGELKEFSIPVLYNYADDVTRWLSRQAPRDLQNPPAIPPKAPPVQPPPFR